MNNILSGTKYCVSPEGACAKNLSRRFFSPLAPKIQILHAICGLDICDRLIVLVMGTGMWHFSFHGLLDCEEFHIHCRVER